MPAVPVPLERWTEAVERLEAASFAPLSQADMDLLFDSKAKSHTEAGVVDPSRFMEILDQQDRLHRGDYRWHASIEYARDSLRKFMTSTDTSHFRAYLVRGFGKREDDTGGFEVRSCEDTLLVTYSFLGRLFVPHLIRRPVVVLLDHEPKSVYVDWAMAE